MVDPEGPQITMLLRDARWISKATRAQAHARACARARTHTHTFVYTQAFTHVRESARMHAHRNMQYLLLLYVNSGSVPSFKNLCFIVTHVAKINTKI